MKKVIFALAAVVALAACSKEQTVVADRGDAIGFDSFIENSTRAIDPSYGTNNLVKEFYVWGTVKGNAMADAMLLYNGAKVYDTTPEYGVAYGCDQSEYWLPSATYNFVALAGHSGVTPATGMPATISYAADGTKDLIYTKVGETVTTNPQSVPDTDDVNANKCVAFTFNHLLSKVHFKFSNDSGSANYKFIVKDIKVSGQYTEGTYTIGATTPWAATDTDTVAAANAWSFGHAKNDTTEGADFTDILSGTPVTSNYARLFIPGAQNLTISFTRELWKVGASSATSIDTITAPLATNFAENGAYVINVGLTVGAPISFTIDELGAWAAEQNITIQ